MWGTARETTSISIRESLRKNVDYHLVLNSDVYFTAEELEKCLEYMERHSDTGQLIPHVTYRDGSYQPVCHRIPTPADLILHRFPSPRNRPEMV